MLYILNGSTPSLSFNNYEYKYKILDRTRDIRFDDHPYLFLSLLVYGEVIAAA